MGVWVEGCGVCLRGMGLTSSYLCFLYVLLFPQFTHSFKRRVTTPRTHDVSGQGGQQAWWQASANSAGEEAMGDLFRLPWDTGL